MRFALFLVFLSAVSALPNQLNIHPARDFLSSLISDAFGDDDTTSTVKTSIKSTAVVGSPVTATSSSTVKGKSTLIPPATASATATSTHSTSSISSSASSSSTDTSSITSTQSSTSSSTSTVVSSTSTPAPASTTSTPSPTPSSDPSAQQPQSNSGSGVSGAGIAVAIILTLVILGCIVWALFRFHPGVRAWWLAREEKRRQERSYRDAIDGPLVQGRGGGARDQALGGTRKSMLTSFFAPKTVRLGDGKEIRRKPVNWGASSDSGSIGGMEKVALTEMAAPMARTGTTKSGISAITAIDRSQSTKSNFSAVSALTAHPGRQKDLPPMPPMPPEAVRKQGPDVHKILSRKSIYELA